MQDAAIDVLAKDIDVCRGEFASANATLEEKVELGEGTALWLWDAEVGVDYAAETYAALRYVRMGFESGE